jgi:hypothetical protein
VPEIDMAGPRGAARLVSLYYTCDKERPFELSIKNLTGKTMLIDDMLYHCRGVEVENPRQGR